MSFCNLVMLINFYLHFITQHAKSEKLKEYVIVYRHVSPLDKEVMRLS